MVAEYLVDGNLLEERTLVYVKSANDVVLTVTVRLTYEGLTLSRDYFLISLRDPIMHNQWLLEQEFEAIRTLIDEALPDVIEHDFDIPQIDYKTSNILFYTDVSRIYNERFIFPYPDFDTEFEMVARVTFSGVTLNMVFPIMMKGIASLSHLPVLSVETSGGINIDSKDIYIDATLTLRVYDENLDITYLLVNQPIQIRGRGNSTWWMPKRPYRIKFATKTALFTPYAEKDWVLLANHTDHTLMRNYLAYNLSRDMGAEFAPSATFADFYLNGEFQGNYMITDQIEVSPDRVNIEEKSYAIDTGYLVELDYKVYDWDANAVEGYDFFKVWGFPYSIKSPQPDDKYLSAQHIDFIQDYLAVVYNTLNNQRDYSALIDEASFVDWFLVSEVFKNVDSGHSSVFLTKDRGGKLKMGPVWDFDLSSRNQGHVTDWERSPIDWYTSMEYKNYMYFLLMKYPGFRSALKARWNEIKDGPIQTMIDSVYPTSDLLSRSQHLNFEYWDVMGTEWQWFTSPEVYDAKTYEEQVSLLYNYLVERVAWMDEELNSY
jgi:hypothetical protein